MKLLHTADLHMDSAFEGLSLRKAAIRRQEQRELLQRVVQLANDEMVDALLLCGDLFDSKISYRETGEELVNALRKINSPVFIAPGNHDYYSSSSPYAKLDFSENVHIFSKNEVEYKELSEKNCRIYGAAYTDNSEKDLLKGFCAEKKFGVTNIGCFHGEPSEYAIANSGLDYVALGHIHKPSGLNKAGNTYYSQPGCPEGRGFDELGDRFVNVVSIEGDRCEIRQVPVCKRRYEILNVNVSDFDPLLAIKMALPDDTIRDTYRIILKGEVDAPIDIGRIENALEEYFFSLQIIDNTSLSQDIWCRCGDDTLRGLYLSKMKKLYDEADQEGKLQIENAVKWGLAAMDNREEVVRHDN